MVSDASIRRSKDEGDTIKPTLNDLMIQIESLCLQSGMSYHRTAPVSVGPGIWMFYATPMSEQCKKYGSCQQMPFYAVDFNGKLKLT